MGRTLQGQSEAIALTNLTVGGQSVLYELFRKQLDCADRTIRKLELTYFAASITTAVYLRLGKQPNREKILDAFAMNMLKAASMPTLGPFFPNCDNQAAQGDESCVSPGAISRF